MGIYGSTDDDGEGFCKMDLDEHRARMILEATHAAWSNGDIDGLVHHFTDDLTYFCNTGGPDGGPLTIVGKKAYREMLQQIVDVAESVSVSEYFRFSEGAGRSKVECYIRHKTTRHTLVGSYRQLVTYEGSKISRLEEFHDAAKMIAFWRMISGEAAIGKALLAE